jgi:hypothetical protein
MWRGKSEGILVPRILAAMRSMHDAYNHWIQLLAQYPDLNDVYNRGINDFESLEGNDRGRFFVLRFNIRVGLRSYMRWSGTRVILVL